MKGYGAMTSALEGIRILDLSRVWSGPHACRILGDLGAEVINIVGRITVQYRDIPPEVARLLGIFPNNDPGERPWNRASTQNDFNRNKLGMTLELNTPEGIDLFKRLVKVSDVVLENYSPRVMPNFGLDYPVLKKLNPGIIMCSMPGYGLTGPYTNYVSYGTNLDPASGMASLMGYPGQGPHMSGNAYPDPVASLHAVSAILTALFYRRRTGKGQHIDLAQSESASFLIGEAILGYVLSRTLPPRIGNRHTRYAPHNCYRCKGKDNWVVIVVTSDQQWKALKEAMNNPPWMKEERFSDRMKRWENQDELDAIIQEWTIQYDHYEVMHRLQKMGVTAGAVLSAPELVSDPHLDERGYYWIIDHPETGSLKYCGSPIRLSKTPPVLRRPAPCLGEHNAYVLKEILGFSDQKIERLEIDGVIGTEPIGH